MSRKSTAGLLRSRRASPPSAPRFLSPAWLGFLRGGSLGLPSSPPAPLGSPRGVGSRPGGIGGCARQRHAHSYVLLVRLVAGATVATTRFGMRWAQATFGLRPFASDAQQNFRLRQLLGSAYSPRIRSEISGSGHFWAQAIHLRFAAEISGSGHFWAQAIRLRFAAAFSSSRRSSTASSVRDLAPPWMAAGRQRVPSRGHPGGPRHRRPH